MKNIDDEVVEKIRKAFEYSKLSNDQELPSEEIAAKRPKGVDSDSYYIQRDIIPFRRTEDMELLEEAFSERHRLEAKIQRLLDSVDKNSLDAELIFAWGRYQYYSGVIDLAANAKDDNYMFERGGLSRKQEHYYLWLAHITLHYYEKLDNVSMNLAQAKTEKFIDKIVAGKLECPDKNFSTDWFENMLSKDMDGLKSQYHYNKLSIRKKRELVEKYGKTNSIPPIDPDVYLPKK